MVHQDWKHIKAMRDAEAQMKNPAVTHLAILRAAGDRLAARETMTTDIIRSLNPFYTDEGDSAYHEDTTARRVPDWQIADAVERLLALVEESSGKTTADELRQNLDFRVDRYAEGDAYINGLDQTRWLHMADLVLIRALEMSHQGRRAADEWIPASDVERQYGLQAGTVRKAVHTRFFPAEKRGHDWQVRRSDAEKEWGK